MRIALLNPTYWPEVRRGSERIVHDLGVSLMERGHDVTVICTHRAWPARTTEDGITVVRGWRPPPLAPLRWYEDHSETAPGLAWQLHRRKFDLIHAFFPLDAWVATRMRRLGGPPVVFSLHGIPVRPYLVHRRYRLEMLREAIAAAAMCTVLSEAAAVAFRRYLLAEPIVLPGGVFTKRFAADAPLADAPTVVCAASLGDPRKGRQTLFKAFAMLRERQPSARLQLVRTRDPVMSREPVQLPEGASWVEGDDTEQLARVYSSAWVSVLPAVDEAFGLVLIESLAAGTPVVGARSGAIPEILDSPRVGHLFNAGDPESLAGVLDVALRSSRQPGISGACREMAAGYDWKAVLPRYEAVYEDALASC